MFRRYKWYASFAMLAGWLFYSHGFGQFQCQKKGDTLLIYGPEETQRWVGYGKNSLECAWVPRGDVHDFKSESIQGKTIELQYKVHQDSIWIQAFGNWNEGLQARISVKTGQYNLYREGRLLASKIGYKKAISSQMPQEISLEIQAKTPLMGGGSRALSMDRRGYLLPLYNRAHYGYETHSEQMNYCLPLVLTGQKFMVHLDNSYTGVLDLGKTHKERISFRTDGGRQVLQFIGSGSWTELVENWTDISGRQPLLPLWSLGNISSRFGYHSQREVLKTVRAYKTYGIPLEAIVVDLYWFGKTIKGCMGNFAFDPDSFPDPIGMIQELHQNEVRFIPITEPFILTGSKTWEDAVKNKVLATDSLGNPAVYDFYFGQTGLIDLWDSSGSKWFMGKYQWLMELGADGFWGDLGEPEVHPDWVRHAGGPARKMHNIYGHEWVKQVYQTMLKIRPTERPFILMRAGYSGTQRHGIIPWTGDVNRSWGGLESQPGIALQMGMQGIAWMHSDLGGFAGDYRDEELYLRWLQYGVFQPIFRPHAQEEVPSEPVFWPENTRKRAAKAIALRYMLMPYLIDLMHSNHQKGLPLMRPLFFYEESKKAEHYQDGYFWGKQIWVCPILKKGQRKKNIYLPAGKNWYSWESSTYYKGGQQIEVDLTDDEIPVFVAEGSLIPISRSQGSPEKLQPSDIEWVHYPFVKEGKASGTYTLEFNGKVEKVGWNIEQGPHSKAKIQLSEMKETPWIGVREIRK